MHYEVTREISHEFSAAYPSRISPSTNSDRAHLDLPGILHDQLVSSGVRPDRIAASPDCTYECPERWFSHRLDVQHEIEEFRVQLFFALLKEV